MEVQDLYAFVLLLVLVGIAIGVGVLVLDKFSAATGVTAAASTAINNTRTELANIAKDWLPVVTIVVVAAIILGLVFKSFGSGGMARS